MRKLITFIMLTSLMESAFGDAPILDSAWQWNKNVKIVFINTYWKPDGGLVVYMDNGQYCHSPGSDKTLISTILAMRASSTKGEIVCTNQLDPDLPDVDGYPVRRIHRVRY